MVWTPEAISAGADSPGAAAEESPVLSSESMAVESVRWRLDALPLSSFSGTVWGDFDVERGVFWSRTERRTERRKDSSSCNFASFLLWKGLVIKNNIT